MPKYPFTTWWGGGALESLWRINISNSIESSPKVQSNRKPSQWTSISQSISYITNLNLILRSFWQWRNMMQHYLKMSSPCWHKSYIGGTTKGHDAQFVNQFVYLQGVLEKSTFLKRVHKLMWQLRANQANKILWNGPTVHNCPNYPNGSMQSLTRVQSGPE